LVSDFHYELPEELIAQAPLADRAGSRLLHVDCAAGKSPGCRLDDRQFRDFPELLRPSDLVVFNNTRVFPARLYGRRSGLRSQPVSVHNPVSREFLRGRIEVLLTRRLQPAPNEWECLVRPGRKIGVGEHLFFGERDELQAEVIARSGFGERRIRFAPAPPDFARPDRGEPALSLPNRLSPQESKAASADHFFGLLENIGHTPLPPYITREDSSADRERYQTVYARERGSVAAPTAGLHFTPEILTQIGQRGIQTAEVTLHVGLGTFQPVRSLRVEEHQLHSEAYSISADAAEKINRARSESRRIVAVGTTTVRTLEYAAQQSGGKICATSGEANLFIYPGYKFQLVQALLTNFHLPQSTLLMLVCALGGKENVRRAYDHAVMRRYRFYSYGDCMFLE
jgi:S-adenosylmethionine:tRNA ribosyltransferase-isomerase